MPNLQYSLSIPLGKKLLSESSGEDTSATHTFCKVGRGSEHFSANQKLGLKKTDLNEGYYSKVRAGSFLEPSSGQVVSGSHGKNVGEIFGVIIGLTFWIGGLTLGFWVKSSRHLLEVPEVGVRPDQVESF